MKSRKFFKSAIMTILALSMFSISSCKKDDDGGDGGNAGEGTIVAKVDGVNFESMPMVTFANLTQEAGVSMLQFQGSSMDQNAMVFIINGFDGPGTYPIGGGSNIFNSAIYTEVTPPSSAEAWQAPYDSQQVGEIKVSESTATHVKGTFFYKAKNVNGDGSIVNVTGGAFNIKLTEL